MQRTRLTLEQLEIHSTVDCCVVNRKKPNLTDDLKCGEGVNTAGANSPQEVSMTN